MRNALHYVDSQAPSTLRSETVSVPGYQENIHGPMAHICMLNTKSALKNIILFRKLERWPMPIALHKQIFKLFWPRPTELTEFRELFAVFIRDAFT